MSARRIFLLTSLITIAVVVVGLLAWQPWQAGSNAASTSGTAQIGGPFTLVDQDGNQVTEAVLDRKVNVIYFGYTYCPDVCPMTLQDITSALDMMGDDAAQVRPILITVDPDRDTVAVLKDYVGWFHPDMIGLTGTNEQIDAVKAAYKVYSAKAPQEDDETGENYLVDHSSVTYVMGPDGTYLTHISYGEPAEEIAKKLQDLL